MKRFFIALLLCVFMLSGCSSETDTTANTNNTSSSTESVKPEEPEKLDSEKEYHIGDTWTVDGQWSLTINSITETDFRNEFSDTNPSHVYMIDYSYENLGYKDANGIMNGLYFDLEISQIVDSSGVMGASYPGEITNYAQETPVGAKCNARSCIGVDTSGTITLHISQYDGNSVEHKATFVLEP